ncbi:MAG: hypothetical protein KGJ49_08200 [Alphaproteobacteria bacterium]|nr:hypothetical protein [Alphaproteobacteria bacterium]
MIQMKSIALTACVLLLCGSSGAASARYVQLAQDSTTGSFVSKCTDAVGDDQKLCNDYIVYVSENESTMRPCYSNIENASLSAVLDWLRQHQEVWSKDSYEGVKEAVLTLYPCLKAP